MKLLIVTDAWRPQVNGVVRTYERMRDELTKLGVAVAVLSPEGFRTLPLPTYPDIRIALASRNTIARRIESEAPDAIHIATEGPLGFGARRWCLANRRPYTTSFHTRFPDYISARAPIPKSLVYAIMRRFHNAGAGCMVATESLRVELAARGFEHLLPWSRGVDSGLFRPRPEDPPLDLPRPLFLYVGRVAVEKNVSAFLDLDLPGSKMVVGEGPALHNLRHRHRDVRFTGLLTGEPLARAYAQADAFVFPSRTDTYGIVLLEALAAGVPVAAYRVPGPADVIGNANVGVLGDDLQRAALAALDIPRARCREFALARDWDASARQFLGNIAAAQGISPDAKLAPVPAR